MPGQGKNQRTAARKKQLVDAATRAHAQRVARRESHTGSASGEHAVLGFDPQHTAIAAQNGPLVM